MSKLERVNRQAAVGRVFWLLTTVYAAIVLLTLFLTAPELRRDGLAALPAMTLTLPASLALMMLLGPIAPQAAIATFIAVTMASGTLNIGIAYAIARWYAGRRRKTSGGESR